MPDTREQGARRNHLERGVVTPIRVGVVFGQYGVPGAEDISARIRAVAAREDLFESVSVVPLGFSGPIMELNEGGRIPAVLSPSLGLRDSFARSASCDLVVPAAHTIHFFRNDAPIPESSTVSLVDVALEEVGRIGVRKVGVMGYSSTKLIRGLYEDPLRQRGKEFVTISDALSHSLDEAIDGFVAGKLSLEEFAAITQAACTNLLQQDAQTIILACSELPVGLHLLEKSTRDVVINPNQLLAEVVIEKALALAQERSKDPQRPDWLIQASLGYQSREVSQNQTETNFARGGRTINQLDVLFPNPNFSPKILLVGLGLKAHPLLCCYEPFKIAAHLEGRGMDYTMTLIDTRDDVIDDIRSRRKLYLATHPFTGDAKQLLENEWIKYLSDTHQENTVIFEQEEGLVFDENVVPPTYYLERGIHRADVSLQFRRKLENGEIQLIQSDIALADLSDAQPYDFAELVNVLYLMRRTGQQLALANIAGHMRRGGFILVHEIAGRPEGTPLFTRFGGWLEDRSIADFGLTIDRLLESTDTQETLLLRKVS